MRLYDLGILFNLFSFVCALHLMSLQNSRRLFALNPSKDIYQLLMDK